MVRSDIINAMIPINRNGGVGGYIWANELASDVTAQIGAMTRNIVIVMVVCFGLTFCLLLLSRRTVRDVNRIITGLRDMRGDVTRRIPPSGGELGEVVNSINAMANGIKQANEETGRAISVSKSVMSNVPGDHLCLRPGHQNHRLCQRVSVRPSRQEKYRGRALLFRSPRVQCPLFLLSAKTAL